MNVTERLKRLEKTRLPKGYLNIVLFRDDRPGLYRVYNKIVKQKDLRFALGRPGLTIYMPEKDDELLVWPPDDPPRTKKRRLNRTRHRK